MEITTIIYGIALIILIPIIRAIIKWRQFVKIVDQIPGPKAYPFIGTMWEFWGVPREGMYT